MATREGKPAAICHTPEEAFEAGQQLVIDRGWRLSDAAIARCAALTRAHLDQIRATEEATKTA